MKNFLLMFPFLMLLIFTGCLKTPNTADVPVQPINENSSSENQIDQGDSVTQKEAVHKFLEEIKKESISLQHGFMADYELKFGFIFHRGSVPETDELIQDNLLVIQETIKAIEETAYHSQAEPFIKKFLELIHKRISIMEREYEVIKAGGHWDYDYNHASDISVYDALRHYNTKEATQIMEERGKYDEEFLAFLDEFELNSQEFQRYSYNGFPIFPLEK